SLGIADRGLCSSVSRRSISACLIPRSGPLTRASPSTPSTLSLHDALPIFRRIPPEYLYYTRSEAKLQPESSKKLSAKQEWPVRLDRKSTRLNSSHVSISYAVFCLKKKTRNSPPNASSG